MADRLSDEELRKSLQDFGESVGPITHTTRSVWEKKLNFLQKKYGSPSTAAGLNLLSSDDSEIENTDVNKTRKKRLSRSSTSPASYLKKLNLTNSPKQDKDVFKKPSPVHIIPGFENNSSFGSRLSFNKNQNTKIKSPNKSLNSTFEFDTSDSDMDPGNSPTYSKTLRHRKKNSTSYSSNKDRILSKQQCDSTNSITKLPLNTKWTSTTLHEDSYKRKDLQGKKGFDTNGYLSNALSNGEFHEEKVRGSSTNYSHCISWMLVIGMIAFFMIIGVLYVNKVQKMQISSKAYTSSKICDKLELLDEEQCKSILMMSRTLHNLLSQVAGHYECSSSRQTRNLTIPEAKTILKNNYQVEDKQNFENNFIHMITLIQLNPEWGIKWYPLSEDNSNLTESALEATHAAKSFWCRVRLSIQWTAIKILYLIVFISLLFLSYFIFKMWKKKRETEERIFYELVEKVIDILQEPSSSHITDAEIGPCRPVVKVRDTLIPPKERKDKQWLWDKVVAFIEENESRVSVEYKIIGGENYKMWRWHPCTNVEGESGKLGKVWQGQAFNNLGKGKNASYSPTPCLKIRNMFDPEIEYGDDWQINIKDAILEKCEGNDGIVHIAIDTSTNEGCVYLLCRSPEDAGKAYNALHGWWFDGKLVTVKYLRYERYLERFPESASCTKPLKPSNNKRLSLSTPFFSSALERS